MNNQSNNVKVSYFSEAELKVVEILARGYSEKEIADKLFLSPHTVSNHLRSVRDKNNLTKNTEVVLLYIAYLNRRKFSLATLREIGLSAILIFINICEYTKIHL